MSDPKHEALESVAGTVSRETFEQLVAFETLFLKWAGNINLVAPSTLGDVWKRHILDSAQLMRLDRPVGQWLDLGSGGGFPGAVIAILLRERPEERIDLVESNRKKSAFLQAARGGFGGATVIHACRIEQVYSKGWTPAIVTARALAPLDRLFDLASPWLTTGARGFFHKGRDYGREVEESVNRWQFDLIKHTSLIDPEGVILEIRNLVSRSAPE